MKSRGMICCMAIVIAGMGVWLSCGGPRCGPGTTLEGGLCVPIPQQEQARDGAPADQRPESRKEPPPPDSVAEVPQERPTESLAEREPEGSSEPPPESKLRLTGEECGPKLPPCASGLCLRDGYCSARCQEEKDCPVGMQCRQINHQKADGTWETFTGCVRPAPKDRPCKRDQDCPSQDSCVVSLSRSGDAVVQICAPSIPGGRAPGEECNASKGIRCRNALCISDSFCSAFCTDKSDCPPNMLCEKVEMQLPGGRVAKLDACTPGRKACQADSDCPTGTVCQPFSNKEGTTLEFFCAPINRQGAAAGKACDPASSSYPCYNNLCIDAGFCFGLCKEDKECSRGFVCVNAETKLPNGKLVKFKGCAPKGDPCKNTKDCAPGLVCMLGTNQAGDQLVPFCGVARLHAVAPGQACVPGSQVPSEQCSTQMCLSDKICSALCKDDKDCPSGLMCRELRVQLQNGKEAKIQGCAK